MPIESGTICLSCSNLADGEFCAGHEMCKNNEVCFIQKYSTNRNEYRYDVGCALPELCRKDLTGNIFGKRSDHSHVLCHKCCNNTDICNARLSCNDTISVPQQKCLSCSEIEDPRMCQNTTTCGKDEICYLHKYSTASKQHLYDVGCKHSALCTHGYTNILGRRLIAGVHQECESCCSGTAMCNHDLQCDNNTQKTINSSCSTINECSGHLVCLSGLCQCSAQFYWNTNTCIENIGRFGRIVNKTTLHPNNNL
ncbi:prion-like-(Q/N-rich) domain-bearing protein 25 [Mytilus edulis]|uniref:prion-like-(Q/N-rich) domain-bearing protein 25 n=1 Tax=Mytilus edulis TaxID=6550 RepID=UPI0039F06577